KFGQSAQYIPVNSITDVFNEVERGRANFGVVPIENSTEGVVNHTLDMFIDSSLLIYGEVLQEVSHNLLSKADRLEDIKTTRAHRQGQDLDHAVREGQSRSAVRAAAPLCLTRDQHDQDRVPSFPP